jgi:hypothetical protein
MLLLRVILLSLILRLYLVVSYLVGKPKGMRPPGRHKYRDKLCNPYFLQLLRKNVSEFTELGVGKIGITSLISGFIIWHM